MVRYVDRVFLVKSKWGIIFLPSAMLCIRLSKTTGGEMSAPCKRCNSNMYDFGLFCDCYTVTEKEYINNLYAENERLRAIGEEFIWGEENPHEYRTLHSENERLKARIATAESHANSLANELRMMYRDYTPVYFEDPWETSPALIAWDNAKGKME